MKVKVAYNEQGQVTGYYPDALNYDLVPSPNIEISSESHQEIITSGKVYEVINGALVEVEQAEANKLMKLNDKKTVLIRQLKLLDNKKIRPLAEGDTAFLQTLNEQTKELRKQLSEL